MVTGGTGFLGAYILRELVQQGFLVKAIRRPSSKLPFFLEKEVLDRVNWVEGDILDIPSLADAMEGIDTVIHAAAVVSYGHADKNRLYQVNIEGTKNVVNICLEKQVSRLVYVSSIAALGRKENGVVVDEATRWQDSPSNTHYSITKQRAELEVWRGFAEGLTGVVINPATIMGYGNWNDGSCAIFKSAFKEFGWYTQGVNGFVAVEDVATAAVELMKTDINEERFIVCSANWSFKKLFDTLADGFAKKRPRRNATPFISAIAWRVEKLKSWITRVKPLITKESAKLANTHTYFDSSKLLKALPNFSYTPLEVAIKAACIKYKKAVQENQKG